MNPHKTFFTSDTHFGHKTMLTHGRPFLDVDEMDEALVRIWNETVPYDAHVYHLGDVSFRSRVATESILTRLHGHKHLIRGNHDHSMTVTKLKDYFVEVVDYKELKMEDQLICMMHFPILSWNKMHYGSWHLHGHSHGNLAPFGRRVDVGVDANAGFKPVSFVDIAKWMVDRSLEGSDHHIVRADKIPPLCPNCGTITDTHYGECR